MDAAGYSAEKQAEIARKVKFYIDLKSVIGETSGDFIDLKLYEPGMQHIIDTYIIDEDARSLGYFDDFTLLDFIISQEEKLESEGNGRKSAAEASENNIRKQIVEQLLLERKQGVLACKALIERYMELAKKVTKPEDNSEYPEGIRKSGVLRALCDNTGGGDEQLAFALHEAMLDSKIDRFRNNPVKEKHIKRALLRILDKEEEMERLFKIICEQEEY
jgi:type I restriction enzyme R subunit